MAQNNNHNNSIPKLGPEPTLLSRKEVDALYETFAAVRQALQTLGVDYIVTGGSLLGAVRQHSILFCDDDIDIAVIDHDYQKQHTVDEVDSEQNGSSSVYHTRVVPNLQRVLDEQQQANGDTTTATSNGKQQQRQQKSKSLFQYQIEPWEGGDRIRHRKMNNIFVDLFVLRPYADRCELDHVIGVKTNGTPASPAYVNRIMTTFHKALISQQDSDSNQQQDDESNSNAIFPLWHFATRKAIEMWPKEVYRPRELFPLQTNLKMGPLDGICGPQTPIRLLKRAFGADCFDVYYQSISHQQAKQQKQGSTNSSTQTQQTSETPKQEAQQERKQEHLPPRINPGGTWETSQKVPLEDQHYRPMQPTLRAARRPTLHGKEQLQRYLQENEPLEENWLLSSPSVDNEDENEELNVDTSEKEQQQQQQQEGLSTDSTETAALSSTMHTKPVRSVLETLPVSLSKNKSIRTFSTQDSLEITNRPNKTIYMDGVFDVLHIGHIEAIRHCARLGNKVILGVTGDEDATGYKREPVISQDERVAMVLACQFVDKVVCPCPLIVTEEFMQQQSIDLVVHGFCNPADAERQAEFFAIPQQMNKFQVIPYYPGQSTSAIIERILNLERDQKQDDARKVETAVTMTTTTTTTTTTTEPPRHTNWFGETLAIATKHSVSIPHDPFPLDLRVEIESHIRKATKRRTQALQALQEATGKTVYNKIMAEFKACGLADIRPISLDKCQFPFQPTLLKCLGLDADFDLSKLHQHHPGNKRPDESREETVSLRKDDLFCNLTHHYHAFQEVYDAFVRSICVPYMASKLKESNITCEEMYYQSFPCIRMILPGEFSIGPHADVAYGHHPCSVNFYLLLTELEDTSASLFVESKPGREDWHPLFDDSVNRGDTGSVPFLLKHFAGAICVHWTPVNHTSCTRVSLDFRLIAGPWFHALPTPRGSGAARDVYREREGYYQCCRRHQSNRGETESWERDGPLLAPDARIGFPWTVKNWDKILQPTLPP